MKSKNSIFSTGRWAVMRVFPCLVFLAVAACGSRSSEQPAPNTIFTGQFVTLDAEAPSVEALAVTGGRIVAMGSVTEIEALAGPATRRIAVPGVAVPGWAEAHGHPDGVAPQPGALDFYAKSKDEVLAAIRKAADATPPGEWITGRAWDEGFWDPPNFPTAADLDAVSTQHPMRFSRLGGHGSWVNSKALELGKIARNTPDPPGGRIVRYAEGNATGFLVDGAQSLLPSSGPAADADEASDARLRAGLHQYARWGVTSVHDAGADLGRIAIYKKLLDAGELPVRVYVMAGSGPAQEQYLKTGPEPNVRGLGMLSIRSFKLMLDGSLGGRGAALTDAYSDAAETHGVDMMTEEELDALIREARAKGIQLSPHVIGDRAVTRALDAFERGGGDTGGSLPTGTRVGDQAGRCVANGQARRDCLDAERVRRGVQPLGRCPLGGRNVCCGSSQCASCSMPGWSLRRAPIIPPRTRETRFLPW